MDVDFLSRCQAILDEPESRPQGIHTGFLMIPGGEFEFVYPVRIVEGIEAYALGLKGHEKIHDVPHALDATEVVDVARMRRHTAKVQARQNACVLDQFDP